MESVPTGSRKRCWSAGLLSVFSQYSNHSALHLHRGGGHDDRRHGGVGRLQANLVIPACAGNTKETYPARRRFPVHPRVCGEHVTKANACIVEPGSSPRVRGTLRLADSPLHTGGSSPRVRGTPASTRARCASSRFIPACAGNTPTTPVTTTIHTVHPRVCGEHLDLGGEQRPDWVHPRVCGEHASRG